MVHALKCRKEYYKEVVNYNKFYEIRKNDRDFRKDDYIALNEIDENGEYTGAHTLLRITHVLSNTKFVQPNYVILSFVEAESIDVLHRYRTEE